ncbi:MAG: sigma-70 family RNA polymerase sigma factor [Saprospiraceae bacterium]
MMTALEFTNQLDTLNNLLHSFALRLTRNSADAEDLYQESTLRAYRNLDKFQVGTNFKSWITTIMRNTFINDYRKNKRRSHVNEPIETFTFAIESTNTISNEGEMNLRLERLSQLMTDMKDMYRVPFLMFYRGWEYQEIAEKLDIPIGTVKSRIFFARKFMKQHLTEV